MRCRQSFRALILTLMVSTALPAMILGATVKGTLCNELGETEPDAGLLFVNVDTSERLRVTTDNEGGFEAELAAGSYEIYHPHEAGTTLLASLELASNEIQNLELTSPVPSDELLAAIGEYTIGLGQTSTINSQNLADLINPFPARKQGRYHGSIYFFHRNDNFDARNFFDPVGEPLPEYKRHQFGVTLGVIFSPRLAVQGSYDGLRINQGSTLLSHVATPAMKRGDFSELGQPIIDPLTGDPFPGNLIPNERLSPVARNVIPTLPDPNRADLDRNFVNNDPKIRDHDSFSVRVDFEPQDNSKLIFDYDFRDVGQALVHSLPTFNSLRTEQYQSGWVSYNQAFSERFIADFRIAFGRELSFGLSRNAGSEGLLDSLGISGLAVDSPLEEGYPEFKVTGYSSFGDEDSPETRVENRLGLDSGFTYALNNHTLRAGFEVRGRQLNNVRSDGLHRGYFSFTGFYTGDAFADFMLGIPNAAYRGIGSDRADLRRKEWELFLRDQWRITPDFDFSFGVRYEYTQPYYSTRNNVSGFYPLLFEPPLDGEIVIAGTQRASELGFDGAVKGSLVFADMNNWAPQLGFAYSPLGTNQMVLRGSYYGGYSSPSERNYVSSLTRNYPFYYTEGVQASPSVPSISLSNPFESGGIPELGIRGIERHIQDEFYQSWRLELQNEVARNWSFEARYIGRRGTQGTREIPGNVPLPGPEEIQARRPNPDFGSFLIVSDGGSSAGHSFEVSAERRLSKGLALNSGFEWNRTFDDGVYGSPSNPRNLNAERAMSSWLPKRAIFLNYILDLPFGSGGWFGDPPGWSEWALDGWRLSGITEIRDGRPFSVSLPGDPNNDGVSGDRPDRIGSGFLDPSQRSIDQWFNTSDFAAPELYGFGNSGRNIIMSPGQHVWDVSVIKRTRLADGDFLELRVEFFNAFNHVNFDRPDANFGTSVFGKIFGADRAREIEIALKYSF